MNSSVKFVQQLSEKAQNIASRIDLLASTIRTFIQKDL